MTPQEKIQKAIEQGIEKIEMVFAPLITAIDIQIGRLEKAGQDPTKYYDLEEDEYVDYIAIREVYVNEKEKAIAEFQAEMDKEVQKIANSPEPETPAEGDIGWEKVVFYIIKYALENGVKIKIRDVEWDSSKPLGGEGSVFDELRSGAMKAIGIDPDSELGKIVKDPLNAAKDLGKNLDRETGKALTDIKVATDKALTNAKRETDKALTDVKKATDKALTDVKKTTDKALTDARKTADKAVKDVAREIGKVIPKVKVTIKIKKPKWL